MLHILPYFDRDVLTPYCKKAKLAFSPALYLYRAENRGEVLGAALFEVGSDRVSPLLYEGEEDDHFLFDGILRAGLNYAGEQGIENGFISEEFRQLHHSLFAQLNYPVQPLFNITNFFQKYKNCGGG